MILIIMMICQLFMRILGIKLKGNEIRYLGPSFRSCISLISKAFMKIENYEGGVVESTPNLFV